jgi:hypothetical protein
MSRFALGIFAAACTASLALADGAYAQRCGPGGGRSQPGFSMQGPMQSGFGSQAGSQSTLQQQGAQSAAHFAAVQQGYAQIVATRRQELVQQAAYRAMMADLNRERFEQLAEAEQKRRSAIRERNRMRAIEQNAEKQLEEVSTLSVER